MFFSRISNPYIGINCQPINRLFHSLAPYGVEVNSLSQIRLPCLSVFKTNPFRSSDINWYPTCSLSINPVVITLPSFSRHRPRIELFRGAGKIFSQITPPSKSNFSKHLLYCLSTLVAPVTINSFSISA